MKGITALPDQWVVNHSIQRNKQENNTQTDFKGLLKNALHELEYLQEDAQQKTLELATGKTDNLHDVVIATEKANVALQLTLEVRNKIVEAYQEVMRMQV